MPEGPVGDANHDGTTSNTQDECVEFVNIGPGPVLIEGFEISKGSR